jgi:hypothetical protein
MKTLITTFAILVSVQAFTQNIEITSITDTIMINSGSPQQIAEIFIANNTPDFKTIAVMETPLIQLPGLTDTVGFFNWLSPYPGEPETIGIEAFDTLRAFYYFTPNGSNGTHVVDVCAWDYYGQSDTVCGTITVIATTTMNIHDKPELKISVYPNPTVDLIHLEYETSNDVYYKIFDINGQTIKSGVNHKKISMEAFPPGTYFIELNTIFRSSTQQIIKR